MNNIEMLKDTLKILKKGHYIKNGKNVDLKLSTKEMKNVEVFLPEDISLLDESKVKRYISLGGKCGYGCENIDSFSRARNNYINIRIYLTMKIRKYLC